MSLGLRDVAHDSAWVRLSGAQKAKKGTPAYTRLINRFFGRVGAAVMYALGWTPNAVTALSAFLTLAGFTAAIVLPPSAAICASVTAILLLAFALDSADGQLARLTGTGSCFGEWLDHVLDCAKQILFHSVLLVVMVRWYNFDGLILLIPLMFTLITSVTFFSNILKEKLIVISELKRGAAPEKVEDKVGVIKDVIMLPTDYGMICFLFMFLAWPSLFQTVYVLLFVANLCVSMLIIALTFKRLSKLAAVTKVVT